MTVVAFEDNNKKTRYSKRSVQEGMEESSGRDDTNKVARQSLGVLARKLDSKQRRSFIKGSQAIEDEASIEKGRLSGPGFNILLSLSIIEDIIDTSSTVVSGGFAALIFAVTTTALAISVWIYLKLQGVKMTNQKIATMAVAWILDIVLIPTNAITLIIIKILENNKIAADVLSKKQEFLKSFSKKK